MPKPSDDNRTTPEVRKARAEENKKAAARAGQAITKSYSRLQLPKREIDRAIAADKRASIDDPAKILRKNATDAMAPRTPAEEAIYNKYGKTMQDIAKNAERRSTGRPRGGGGGSGY